jgi:hypothetical protein
MARRLSITVGVGVADPGDSVVQLSGGGAMSRRGDQAPPWAMAFC